MVLFAAIISLLSVQPGDSIPQNSLPVLHTLNDAEIKSVSGSFETATLTVVLKNDSVLLYPHSVWDYEDCYASTPKRISDAIRGMEKTFTKLEVPPQFPGGEDSLTAYVKRFCTDHAKELKHSGHGDVMISFVVHLKGQRCDYSPVGNYPEARYNLAVKCISEGPDWITGMQNGRKVIAYVHLTIHLYPE
jgi:hypothetical protein